MQTNLKDLERRTYRSTYSDGLWDIYMGSIVISMAFFIFSPAKGYSALNLLLLLLCFAIATLVFRASKKYITLPRMGQVTFGERRRKKKITLALFLGILIGSHGGVVALSIAGWRNPALAEKINAAFPSGNLEHLLVATIGSLIVGLAMVLIAYFNDFPRGYYIAFLMLLAVFFMVYLNQPLVPFLLGVLILIPGMIIFVRFLKKYPRLPSGEPNGKN